jgi:hypothetical protein
MATQFNSDDKNELKAASTAGVLSYAGKGLPSWEGAPEGRNFLNAFKELFARVDALTTEVAAIKELVTPIEETPRGEENPSTEEPLPAQEAPVTENRPGTDL